MSTSVTLEDLKHIPLFAGAGDADLCQLAARARRYTFPRGVAILGQDWEIQTFFVIVGGSVRVFRHSREGRDFTLWVLRAGATLGTAALFSRKHSLYSAAALTESWLIGIDREALVPFLDRNPRVVARIAEPLLRGFRAASNTLVELASYRAQERIVRSLLTLRSDFGQTLPFSHQEIADMAGTTRETTSKVLAQLAGSRVTRSLRGSVAILDGARLRALATPA